MTSPGLARKPDVEAPGSGEAVEIAPGVLWVRLAMPFALDHINVWLLDEGDAWTLVDTGLADERTRLTWEALSRRVLQGRPVRRVVSTHYHPDHIGLAGWFRERCGAELWTSQGEWLHARMYSLESLESAEAAAAALYRRAGVPPDAVAPLVERAQSYNQCALPPPATYRRLSHGASLAVGGEIWRVVVGRGHSPEHVCLHSPDRGLLVSGDQVLPSITPNVSVWPSEPDAEPLSDFLDSLATLRALPDDVLVLPSHGAPFVGLHRRLDELAAHHRERLDLVLAACAEPRTVHEVMGSLFPRGLDPHQTTFALGESMAHLNHLVAGGVVSRYGAPGAPDRYVRAATCEGFARA